nr:tetratricopeptide repeat protein [Allomuricauda sp.]
MKKLFIFFTLSCFSALAQNDPKISGLVVEQNSQYHTGSLRFLSNTQIISNGAIPQRTDIKGEFTMFYPGKKNGQVASIYATKNGYKVINSKELKATAVIGRKTPLKIVMCEEQKFFENQIAYYQIAKNSLLQSYQREIDILKKENQESKRLMYQLRERFQKEIKNYNEAKEMLDIRLAETEGLAKSLSDRFLTINLDDQSENYREAFKLFLKGDINGAIRILDEVNLETRLEINSKELLREEKLVEEMEENITKRQVQIQQDIDQCLLKARLHTINHEFEEAEESYDLAIQYEIDDEDFPYEYIQFLYSINKWGKGQKYVEEQVVKYIELQRTDDYYSYELATMELNLGVIYFEMGRYQLGAKYLIQGKKNFEKLLFQDPKWYFPEYIRMLLILGEKFTLLDIDKAKKYYEFSLEILETLKKDVEFDDSLMIATWSGIANIYRNLNQHNKAISYAQKSLSYLENQDSSFLDESTQKQLIVNNYGLLGKVYSTIDSINQAIFYHQKSLELMQELAKENPLEFEGHLANDYYHLALVFIKSDYPSEGIEMFQKSRSIFYRMMNEVDESYSFDYVKVLFNLASGYHSIGNIEAAAKTFNEAKTLADELILKHPTEFYSRYLNHFKGYADFLIEMKLYQPAIDSYNKIIEWVLSNDQPKHFDIVEYFGPLHFYLGLANYKLGKMEEAENYFLESLQFFVQTDLNEDKNLNEYILTLINIGVITYEKELPPFYLNYLDGLNHYYERIPEAMLYDMVKILSGHGHIKFRQGGYVKSMEALRLSIEILNYLIRTDPSIYYSDYFDVVYYYGELLETIGDYKSAIDSYEELLLSAIEKEGVTSELDLSLGITEVYAQLGFLAMNNYDFLKSEDYLNKGLSRVLENIRDNKQDAHEYSEVSCGLVLNLLTLYSIPENQSMEPTKKNSRYRSLKRKVKNSGLFQIIENSDLEICKRCHSMIVD